LQLVTLRRTVGPEEAFAVPAAVEMGFQIGHIFVECVDRFFAQIDGVEAGRGEEECCQSQAPQTMLPHLSAFQA
jgi:hypothetical protein